MRLVVGHQYQKISTGTKFVLTEVERNKRKPESVYLYEVDTIRNRYISVEAFCAQYKKVYTRKVRKKT